ncbi:glycoside hydrolase superfamily [Podospora conica]|nr:glycoside hydrolase superfamily [Schizothecium conicum]
MFYLFAFSLALFAPHAAALVHNGATAPPETTISSKIGPTTPYHQMTPLLDTPWTLHATKNPWPQHPRPLLYRDKWQTLNGFWTYQQAVKGDELNPPPLSPLARTVLIPSCIESVISGIKDDTNEVKYMWFARNFSLPIGWDAKRGEQRVLLHFEAVDYEATVFLNGDKVGFNRGGYSRFSIDITDSVNHDGSNELLVFVFDPTDADGYHIPNGKQTLSKSHIFYTPCAGIWQGVWLEYVPNNYITSMDIDAGADGTVTIMIHSSGGDPPPVDIYVLDDDGRMIAGHEEAVGNKIFVLTVPMNQIQLWTPDTPRLYNLTVKMGDDIVSSYTGFRTISSGIVKGVRRPLLNGKFVFHFGTLDQGYWPDGIYVPPTLEAMAWDLLLLKKLGMNMVRKHIKVEPDLFYYACDRIGLLVYQDMPSMKATVNVRDAIPTADDQAEFERQLDLMINQHKSNPSIVTWVLYNEGWGQIKLAYQPEIELVERVRKLDPTRLIDATSGWYDHGAGDFSDNHHYSEPQCGTPFYSNPSAPYDPKRIGFQGEFGGIGHVPPEESLWPVQAAKDTINQTYELGADLAAYNYRSHVLLGLLRDQIALYGCSGAVWTQTTDVEGEVNGLVSYDRRVVRVNETQWREDIQALYRAAEAWA